MPDKLNILIIGGSSFVAKNFILYHQFNYNIKSVSRVKTRNENEVAITDFSKIPNELFHGIDIVLNCAAIVHQRKKVQESLYNKINFELATELAEKSKKNGVKIFIQLSTIAVYGNTERINAESLENPINPYGKSKLLADKQITAIADEHFKVIIFRAPMIYGGGEAPGNMMRLIKIISTGLPLPFKDLSNKRDFIHIVNLVGFIDAAIKKQYSGIFLVSDNSSISITELYKIIINELGIPDRSFRLPKIAFSIMKKIVPGTYGKLFGNLTIDISFTMNMIGLNPENRIKQGIKEMITYQNIPK